MRELHPSIDLSECYFFFDEIQQATSADQAKIRALFQKFIYHGGFPEIVQQEEALRVNFFECG
ncbi:MAG TPA: hypothetical protein PK581_08470 [Caldisericia bacterium]|nr:hypothetical protein [Caldisericia bacterium]